MKLNKTDISTLKKQNNDTLAEWWSQLNRWEWPDDLPNPEPRNADKPDRRGAIMNWIKEKISHKECLRNWNKDRMTNEEFEAWYSG